MPKYDIDVQLSETDGNAFFLMGRVTKAMKRQDVSPDEIQSFRDEAMSGDYDHLLRTCMEWVNVS